MLERAPGSAPVSVLTTGDVSIILAEPERMALGQRPEQAIVIEHAKPGQVIRREPTVCVSEESKQAYLRARILVSGIPEQQADALLGGLEQTAEWNLNPQDGYYYYKNSISPGQQIPVFESIHIPEHWKEVERFQIDVMVEAVEASHLTPRVDAECRTMGWIAVE